MPTTLALSVVELVLGCTVSTNGVAVVEDLSFPVVGEEKRDAERFRETGMKGGEIS